MRRAPPSATRTDTHLPYTTRFRAAGNRQAHHHPERDLRWRPHGQGLRHGAARDQPRQAVGRNTAHPYHEGGPRPGRGQPGGRGPGWHRRGRDHLRSEEHTSELQSLMRISYAVFCLKKKTESSNNKTYRHGRPRDVQTLTTTITSNCATPQTLM